MNIELRMLIWSVILGIVQILLATHFATRHRGFKWNMSSRDQVLPPLPGLSARIGRAAENFKETFPFFLAAVLVAQIQLKDNSMTAVGAQLYFWARLIYVPLYAFNVIYVRTLVWIAATAGIVLILAAAL